MKPILTLLLVAGCWLMVGCQGRQNLTPWPTNAGILPPMPLAITNSVSISRKLAVEKSAAYDAMAPAPLPQCPPLHWEASPGWGGLVISGPALETLDWNHTGCPQYPKICTALAWLTETTDYVLPVQKAGNEFAKIIPFETE